MARKKDDSLTEKQMAIISDRIKNLFELYGDKKDSSITQKKISEITGIPTTTINRAVIDGSISLSNLIKLADFFNVNLDYLVGRSESKTTNIKNRSIAEKLKLDDKSIDNIISIEEPGNKAALNHLLESDLLRRFVEELKFYYYSELIIEGSFLFYFSEDGENTTVKKIGGDYSEIVFLEDIKEILKEMKKELKDNGKK